MIVQHCWSVDSHSRVAFLAHVVLGTKKHLTRSGRRPLTVGRATEILGRPGQLRYKACPYFGKPLVA